MQCLINLSEASLSIIYIYFEFKSILTILMLLVTFLQTRVLAGERVITEEPQTSDASHNRRARFIANFQKGLS